MGAEYASTGTPKNVNKKHLDSADRVGLIRRLMSIVYDTLLLAAVLFVAGLPTAFIDIPAGTLGSHLLWLYMLSVAFAFFGWFWTHGGQTLGMKTWRIRVEQLDGSAITWRRALLRFAAALFSWALFGLGFLWAAFHPERLALHDLVSRTRLTRARTGDSAPGSNSGPARRTNADKPV